MSLIAVAGDIVLQVFHPRKEWADYSLVRVQDHHDVMKLTFDHKFQFYPNFDNISSKNLPGENAKSDNIFFILKSSTPAYIIMWHHNVLQEHSPVCYSTHTSETEAETVPIFGQTLN